MSLQRRVWNNCGIGQPSNPQLSATNCQAPAQIDGCFRHTDFPRKVRRQPVGCSTQDDFRSPFSQFASDGSHQIGYGGEVRYNRG